MVTRQWTGMPQRHPDATPVDPANAEGNPLDLPWEVSRLPGRPGLSTWQQAEMGVEKSAEAIVTLPSVELVRHPNAERRGQPLGRAGNGGQRAELFMPRSQSEKTRWTRSDSKASLISGPFTRGRGRARATTRLATADPELGCPRSRKRPRRQTQHEP